MSISVFSKNEKVNSILNEAHQFSIHAKKHNQSVTYSDYEKFKHLLHNNDLFGYEGQLAYVLGL